MKEELKIKFLSDLIDFKNGKSIKPSSGDIPIYGGNGILGYGEKYNYNNILIIGRVGAYCGSIYYHKEKCWVSDNAIAGEVKSDYSIDYLYYLMKSLNLNDRQVGSSQPLLTQGVLNNISVKIYEFLQTQQSIAAVLSALDKKIALNKQINARLEEMAKTLYDYWFVQFDFPDVNGKPYKSSGGEMVFDETLKREIPKGWEVKSLKDVLVNRSDNIKSEDLTSNMPYTPIDSLPMRKMTFSDFQKIENARTSLIRYSFNDILIGAMRVYFHRVCIAPFDGITRSTTIVLKPKKQNHLPFLYQLCNEEKTINFASKVSIGTQQPYVNWVNGLAEYKFAMPNLELIERYSIKIMPLIKSVITREKQNHHLTQLRDFLLPMLMNGQVSVTE
ncbi:restriction endonuclease subunit S [Neisseria meningitidis]|uniref:restriction endonuclease subunit S n=1 Tax=Neisseria meningitidis TaxID=487 RepID=UPI000FCA5939|nr:restriction endonuclease subunit S [Neisseria meningitidis]